MERYFVVVFGRDADAMRALQKFGFDLFAQTAKPSDRKDYPFSIDGLLTPAEIETLKQAGYRVQKQAAAEERARGAQNPADFSHWLQGMEIAVTQERAAAARATAAAAGAGSRKKTADKKPKAKAVGKKAAGKKTARKKGAGKKSKPKTAKRR